MDRKKKDKDKDKKRESRKEKLDQSQSCAEGRHLQCNGIKCGCECHAI
jgi:hypothetical protein